jgi:hypothetical protein
MLPYKESVQYAVTLQVAVYITDTCQYSTMAVLILSVETEVDSKLFKRFRINEDVRYAVLKAKSPSYRYNDRLPFWESIQS